MASYHIAQTVQQMVYDDRVVGQHAWSLPLDATACTKHRHRHPRFESPTSLKLETSMAPTAAMFRDDLNCAE